MTRLATLPCWIAALGLGTAAGCQWNQGTPAPPAQPLRGVAIVAAAVGDAEILPGLVAQRGEWSATRGAQVTVKDAPIDPKSIEGVDVVVFRGDRLGELVDKGVLVAVPESLTRPPAPVETPEARSPGDPPAEAPPDPLRFNEIVPAARDQVGKYGSVRVGLPYGGSALVLAYHRAAFEGDTNRAAAKEARLELEPPQTWGQLDALAKFFHGRDWDGDGQPEAGIALALGADPEGVGDATYLARAAALGQHRDQYSFLFDADTMAPRVDSPPFVEALRGLAALKDLGPPGHESFDAAAARRAFGEGKAAILIDRAERVGSWGNGKSIGVASLPGSKRVYDPGARRYEEASPPNRPSYLPYGGGWLVGVTSAATGPRREAALDFAAYLVGPETAARVLADRAFPVLAVRTTLLSTGPPDPGAAPGVDARQWSDAVTRTLMAERVIPGIRIPEAAAYLADLAKARAAVLKGEPAEGALKATARAWSERTERLGRARQLWHYRRSLNTLSTTDQPPAR